LSKHIFLALGGDSVLPTGGAGKLNFTCKNLDSCAEKQTNLIETMRIKNTYSKPVGMQEF